MKKKHILMSSGIVRENSVAALKEALKITGGIVHLSRATGISRQLLYRFLKTSLYGVSARYVLLIEEATGGLVTRQRLRMDVYPWGLK